MSQGSAVKWDPGDYASHSTAQQGWALDLIGRLRLHGDETVLDVGSGDGKITAEIARAVPRGSVLGVDNSPEHVAYARHHFPSWRIPNLDFEVMDARRLASDRLFDVIFSNATLHWLDDHRAFLAGCARLLELDGRLAVSCGGDGNARDIFAAAERLIATPAWRRYFVGFKFPYYFYSVNHYREWLPDAGLVPTRLELVERDMVYSGSAGLAGWIRTTWLPYTQRVPEARRQAFIDDLVGAYLLSHPVDLAGQVHVRMVRLEVDAVLAQVGVRA